jgi:adenine-specific DNA-methyltransferase
MEVSVATVSENTAQNTTTAEPEKLDLRSHNIAEDKKAELLQLFPEIRTEGGKIDFDKLKLALGEMVDVGRERYGMNWPGKADCFKTLQQPSLGTLLPRREESVNFDTTENLVIEGDNLEVLKLLQKSYLGKVKMIYIDPPYNTGSDFIYPDNYSESLQTYLEYTGQVDDEGRRFSTNPETDGRFHSKWLNMMYPRLYLARNLLSEDGAIFISVDDHEVNNLRKLMDEIFGEEAFVSQICVVNNLKGRNDRKYVATAHEYLMFYAMPLFESNGLQLSQKQLAEYKQTTESGAQFQWRDLRKRGGADTRAARPKLFFPLYANPRTGQVSLGQDDTHSVEVYPKKSDGSDGCWRWGHTKVSGSLNELKASKVEGKDRWNVAYRVYLEQDGEERTAKPKSTWMGPEFSTDAGTKSLAALIPGVGALTPKPVGLIRQLAFLAMSDGDLCLDFFAGSGTTAQAVLEASAEDGMARRFLLVQLPEKIEGGTHSSISEVTKDRCRKVVEKLKSAHAGELPLAPRTEIDLGFRVFTLSESGLRPWRGSSAKGDSGVLAQQLELHADHIRPDRTSEQLLFELLLKSGFPLTDPVETVVLAGKEVYSISDGAMLICLDRNLTHEVIKAMADLHPQRVVCLDEGFAGNDQLKTNAVQTMKARGVTSFRTV